MQPRARTPLAKESRRLDLLLAARALFTRQGYIMPSVIDITLEAQLAKGTFYLYFQTKEELFLELLEMGFAQWLKALQESVNAEVMQSPSLLADAILRPILHDPCFLQLASMTQTILEQNLRSERATAFKIRLGEGIESLAQNLAENYQQSAADLIDLMMDCYAAIIGTWQNTQVTASIALIKDKIPYPFLFQSFEDRIGPLVTAIIVGKHQAGGNRSGTKTSPELGGS